MITRTDSVGPTSKNSSAKFREAAISRWLWPLDADELCAVARRRAGFMDFGDPEVESRLSVLVKSLEEEAELRPRGRLLAWVHLCDLLETRLRLQRLWLPCRAWKGRLSNGRSLSRACRAVVPRFCRSCWRIPPATARPSSGRSCRRCRIIRGGESGTQLRASGGSGEWRPRPTPFIPFAPSRRTNAWPSIVTRCCRVNLSPPSGFRPMKNSSIQLTLLQRTHGRRDSFNISNCKIPENNGYSRLPTTFTSWNRCCAFSRCGDNPDASQPA